MIGAVVPSTRCGGVSWPPDDGNEKPGTSERETASGHSGALAGPLTDIEDLLQWAVSRSGRLPWRRDDERDLTMNPYTARLRRRPKIGWHEAEVYALTINGRTRVLSARRLVPGSDAERVLVAIAGLGDAALSEMVRACARSRIRPDWMPGVEPKRVERLRRHRKKHRGMVRYEWAPCSPADVLAARAAYSRWHAALVLLGERLACSGLAAPSEPWKK